MSVATSFRLQPMLCHALAECKPFTRDEWAAQPGPTVCSTHPIHAALQQLALSHWPCLLNLPLHGSSGRLEL